MCMIVPKLRAMTCFTHQPVDGAAHVSPHRQHHIAFLVALLLQWDTAQFKLHDGMCCSYTQNSQTHILRAL